MAKKISKTLNATLNKASGKYYVLSVYKKSALYSVASLLNGKFRTPKIEALHRLISWLNNLEEFPTLELLPVDESSIKTNHWLAGFSDSDANFSINFSIKDCLAKNISFTYRISQKQKYTRSSDKAKFETSFFPVMNLIALAFNSKVELISRNRINPKTKNNYVENGYLVRVGTINSRLELIKYFDTYQLFSSKYLDYLSWKKGLDLVNENKHKTIIGTNKLNLIKTSMNSKRTKFNWKHLSKFSFK